MEPIKFKDMTPEQRSEIVEALVADPASVESYQPNGVWLHNPYIHQSGCYRIKPRQLAIPWDVLRPEIVYAAMDMGGLVFGYKEEPSTLTFTDTWGSGRGRLRIDHAIYIDTTGIDWRESMVMRPGYDK